MGYGTARALFVAGDVQTVMQAFLGGRIRVNGDLSKLLDPRSGIWPTAPTSWAPPAQPGVGGAGGAGEGLSGPAGAARCLGQRWQWPASAGARLTGGAGTRPGHAPEGDNGMSGRDGRR